VLISAFVVGILCGRLPLLLHFTTATISSSSSSPIILSVLSDLCGFRFLTSLVICLQRPLTVFLLHGFQNRISVLV